MKRNKTANRFKTDSRARLRRLGNLGISGHQPSILAYCEMTKEEKDRVIAAILEQTVANSKKAEMQLEKHRERIKESQGDAILLRIARVATGATVRWKRTFTENPIKGNRYVSKWESKLGRSKISKQGARLHLYAEQCKKPKKCS